MDLGSIFLILALLVLVGLFISRPLFERSATSPKLTPNVEQVEHSALLAERDRVLTALQELDFDYTLGKIPEEDYPEQRQLLLYRGKEVLQKLDSVESEQGGEISVEDRIEQAIAIRRADAGSPPTDAAIRQPAGNGRGVSASVASPDDEIEVLLANRRRVRQEKAVGFCPQCGGPLQKSDRFCPKCGAQLA